MSSIFQVTMQMRSKPTLEEVLSNNACLQTSEILANCLSGDVNRTNWPREIQTLGPEDEFADENDHFKPDGSALANLVDLSRRLERGIKSPDDAKDASEGLVTIMLSNGTLRSFKITNNLPVATENPFWLKFLKVVDFRYKFSRFLKIFFSNL